MRFGYDGARFRGWARQPGLRTIEGEIREGLQRYALGDPSEPLRLDVASRTDRGVSARANALVVRSVRSGLTLLRALNAIAPELFFTAARRVPDEFRVRSAVRRVYRYFEPRQGPGSAAWSRAARLFAGEVDVRSFGRGLPSANPAVRSIESVRGIRVGGGRVVEVRAPSFVWGEVRKIVGALREVEAGRLAPGRLAAALRGDVRLAVPMAEPEPLVLWDVEYPESWEVRWEGPNRYQRAHQKDQRESLWVREGILRALDPAD